MSTNIQSLRSLLDKQKGKKEEIEKNIKRSSFELKELTREIHRHEEAREIIREVGIKTQQQLQFHISKITSLALEAVFPDPYELVVEFVQRRNKTECDILFMRDGNKIKPIDSSGVGAIDVAAFALRIAAWAMQSPRTRNTIILDEPFKHLKGETANLKVLQMVHEISQKLGLQIIMISDERIPREDIIDNADRIFEVKKIRRKLNGQSYSISKVTQS
jgi:hypothetical protein